MPKSFLRKTISVSVLAFFLSLAYFSHGAELQKANQSRSSKQGSESKPIIYNCEDGKFLSILFKLGDPATAELTSTEGKQKFTLGPSGSGARYIQKDNLFWVKGDEAMYETQGKSTTCHTVPPIQFSRGSSSKTVTGSIKGYATSTHLFRAKAGQTVTLKLTSKNRFLYFGLLESATLKPVEGGPLPGTLTEWKGTLPQDGDYLVHVFLMRAEARRNGTADYSLEIQIH